MKQDGYRKYDKSRTMPADSSMHIKPAESSETFRCEDEKQADEVKWLLTIVIL